MKRHDVIDVIPRCGMLSTQEHAAWIRFLFLLQSIVYLVIFGEILCTSLVLVLHWIFFSYLHVAVEEPTETAMLLSLTGVGSIIANQWFTTLQENAERLDILSESEYLPWSSLVCFSDLSICAQCPSACLLSLFFLCFSPVFVQCFHIR